MPHAQAARAVQTFRELDERRLFEHYTHRNGEESLQDLAKAVSKELGGCSPAMPTRN